MAVAVGTQPRPQGLLLDDFQDGGSSVEDPGTQLSPPQRLKGFFSGGEGPLSNVSAGTELQATAESAGASARYHAQDGRHPGEATSCGLLAGVACVPCISKNGVQDFEVK